MKIGLVITMLFPYLTCFILGMIYAGETNVKEYEAVTGKITEYHFQCPQPGYTNYVQVEITQDYFVQLEDKQKKKIYERSPDSGQIRSRRPMDYGKEQMVNPAVNSVPDDGVCEGEYVRSTHPTQEEIINFNREENKQKEIGDNSYSKGNYII